MPAPKRRASQGAVEKTHERRSNSAPKRRSSKAEAVDRTKESNSKSAAEDDRARRKRGSAPRLWIRCVTGPDTDDFSAIVLPYIPQQLIHDLLAHVNNHESNKTSRRHFDAICSKSGDSIWEVAGDERVDSFAGPDAELFAVRRKFLPGSSRKLRSRSSSPARSEYRRRHSSSPARSKRARTALDTPRRSSPQTSRRRPCRTSASNRSYSSTSRSSSKSKRGSSSDYTSASGSFSPSPVPQKKHSRSTRRVVQRQRSQSPSPFGRASARPRPAVTLKCRRDIADAPEWPTEQTKQPAIRGVRLRTAPALPSVKRSSAGWSSRDVLATTSATSRAQSLAVLSQPQCLRSVVFIAGRNSHTGYDEVLCVADTSEQDMKELGQYAHNLMDDTKLDGEWQLKVTVDEDSDRTDLQDLIAEVRHLHSGLADHFSVAKLGQRRVVGFASNKKTREKMVKLALALNAVSIHHRAVPRHAPPFFEQLVRRASEALGEFRLTHPGVFEGSVRMQAEQSQQAAFDIICSSLANMQDEAIHRPLHLPWPVSDQAPVATSAGKRCSHESSDTRDREPLTLQRIWLALSRSELPGPRPAPRICLDHVRESLIERWLSIRGLREKLLLLQDCESADASLTTSCRVVYGIESLQVPLQSKGTSARRHTTAYHVAWFYSLWWVLHHGCLFEDSTCGDAGFAAVRCFTDRDAAISAACAHALFGDNLYHRVVLEVDVDEAQWASSGAAADGSTTFVVPVGAVSLSRVHFILNHPPGNRERRFDGWQPELEAIPVGKGVLRPVQADQDFDEFVVEWLGG
eukprot:TRINITY_DN58959_c0_g1_i1.p1 TRINITY_DN58959_c0_g1~~TRINITY_DN58959_c0_g1_i1.p1  ORF type:complete len:801 (-),score=72.21 TRINITY_DN58959_c0_g1_i1:318-2720(-)